MLRKLVLAVSFSTLAAFSGSVLAAAFDVTDIEGRKVHFEDQPKTFVVANYIANFMMVGGAPGLEKVVALTKTAGKIRATVNIKFLRSLFLR